MGTLGLADLQRHCGHWSATFILPKAHTRADGFSRRDILKKIDYVGGVLSIMGLTLL